jgi:hypothetical protein
MIKRKETKKKVINKVQFIQKLLIIKMILKRNEKIQYYEYGGFGYKRTNYVLKRVVT